MSGQTPVFDGILAAPYWMIPRGRFVVWRVQSINQQMDTNGGHTYIYIYIYYIYNLCLYLIYIYKMCIYIYIYIECSELIIFLCVFLRNIWKGPQLGGQIPEKEVVSHSSPEYTFQKRGFIADTSDTSSNEIMWVDQPANIAGK